MNRLQYETSPYLLQHANNPVDWYAWKDEAFAAAKRENKPILVSIGYSTCHWCHVMEHESFEDQETADFMNAFFINIKVDREERPDVDQIYMEACQLINGNGGWPLNCFLLPDKTPFFAGTYFPPEPNHGRPSWLQVLNNMFRSYRDRRETVEKQAKRLMDTIRSGRQQFQAVELLEQTNEQVFNPVLIQNIHHKLKDQYDKTNGGFGGAPKFPGSMNISYLLDYYHFSNDQSAIEHVHFTLQKMIGGGIYDQLGGGFARYTVDAAWLIPHFEKMLYDNALLIDVIADAYKQQAHDMYKHAIEQSLAFVDRELSSPEGGFYSALDADSEGKEGTYYIWSQKEIDDLLGQDAVLFSDFYGSSVKGNWESSNILWQAQPLEEVAGKYKQTKAEIEERLVKNREILFDYRAKRIRPGLDDKHLLHWNALMITAYCKAYKALGHEQYKKRALNAIEFVQKNFQNDDALWHTYKNGKAQYEAFLDDYAFWIAALLEAYTITFDLTFIDQATTYLNFVLTNFFDESDNLFYFTSAQQKDIPLRRKELFDNALPSGNATMALNLHKLSIIKGNNEWAALAERMLKPMTQSVERYPGAFGRWVKAMIYQTYNTREVVIIGKEAVAMAMELQTSFMPNTIIMTHAVGDIGGYPLLKGRKADKDTLIFVCENYQCQLPVKTIEEAKKILKIGN